MFTHISHLVLQIVQGTFCNGTGPKIYILNPGFIIIMVGCSGGWECKTGMKGTNKRNSNEIKKN